MIAILATTLLGAMLTKTLWDFSWILYVRRYLRRHEHETVDAARAVGQRLFIVVPVLHEVPRTPELSRFMDSALRVSKRIACVIATTERERLDRPERVEVDTWTALKQFMSQYYPENLDRVHRIHYPLFNATLAQQLGFAIDSLPSLGAHPSDYVLLYNADSVTHTRALRLFLAAIDRGKPVVQQSALFVGNLGALIRRNRWIAAVDAVFQTRWTLCRELPRYLISSHRIPWLPGPLRRSWMCHLVGHGLMIRLSVLRDVGGLRDPRYGLEDSALGFAVRDCGYEVDPIPVVEFADAPTTMASLIRQKAGWIRGPLAVPEYFRAARRSRPRGRRGRRIILLLQTLYSGAKWSLTLPLLVLFFWTHWQLDRLPSALAAYLFYCFGTASLTIATARRVPDSPLLGLRLPLIRLVVLSAVAPFTHGWFGLRGTMKLMAQLAHHTQRVQHRTD